MPQVRKLKQVRSPDTTEIEQAMKQAWPIILGKIDSPDLSSLPPIYAEKMGEALCHAAELGQREARWLVDMYYTLQESRIRADSQRKSLAEHEKPNQMMVVAARMTAQLERNLQAAMFVYASSQKVGQWLMSLPGIAHTLAAGLLAYIDIERCQSVSQIWRYAGLDPTLEWYSSEKAKAIVKKTLEEVGGSNEAVDANGIVTSDFLARVCLATNRKPERLAQLALFQGQYNSIKLENLAKALTVRPWNAHLKTLCWKIGESFSKTSRNPNNLYAQVMAERRLKDNERNEAGELADQAENMLKRKKIRSSTVAYKKYKKGLLPDGHLHARAKRYAVKLFLSHLFHVMYEDRYGEPPEKPYIIAHGGHVHYIPPPNWPMANES